MRPTVLFRLVLAASILVANGAVQAQSLKLVGKSDLGGAGLNGDLSVVGTTAVVAAGMMAAAGVHAHLYNPYPCPAISVKLVDVATPERPKVVGTIPFPAGVAAHGVSAARVNTPLFKGDLLAIALTMCSSAGSTLERGLVYYDITNPSKPQFLGRYQADADLTVPDTVPAGCGAPPDRSPQRCASSQHSVSLVQRPDGRVLSMSVEPGASSSKYPSGDFRIVDVTNPRKPVQIGAFPPAGEPIFSVNGCRPFSAGHGAGFAKGGSRGIMAFYDGGLFIVDLSTGKPMKLGQFQYPKDRSFEGSAAYASSATVDGRDIALISEADFIGPSTSLEVSGPPRVAGSKFACEAIFTLYDQAGKTQLYKQPGYKVSGELTYVGRGCPAGGVDDMHADMSMSHDDEPKVPADPYLGDPNGRIALVDRGKQPQQAELPATVCSMTDRVKAAQKAGARGVIVLQTSATAPEAFSPDGDPAGISIPVAMIDKADGDAIRSALCPTVEKGRCAGGERVSGTLRDAKGEWGALRMIDITDPAMPRELSVYRTPRSNVFPPTDLSVFSPQRPAVRGHYAVVPWNSDGARMIDLSGGTLREVASFVPPDASDPTGVLPAKAYVMSIGMFSLPASKRAAARDYVLVSDINSGLYVLEATWGPAQAAVNRLR
ncbi:MAG: PA domain-containing protein [Gemmatimonadaceae bacterium]